MTNPKTAVLYGFLIWLIVMAVAMAAFPLRSAERPLFESIMPVTLAITVAACAAFYFDHVGNHFLREGVEIGAVWLAVNFALDQLVFSYGPMRMNWTDYVKDIGITYLMIPAITTGYGWVLDKHHPASEAVAR